MDLPPSPEKVCVVCGTDCSSIPRFKDPEDHYLCQDCYEVTLTDSSANSPASEATIPVDTEVGSDEWEDPCCQNHPGVPATRQCQACRGNYCADCMKVRTLGQNKIEFCPHCGGRCRPIGSRPFPSPDQPQPAQVSFVSAFAYPFKESGWAILAGGSLFFGLIDLAIIFAGSIGAGVLGLALVLVVTFGILAYLAAFSFEIIRSSAQGEGHLPGWPDLSDTWQDLGVPLFHFLGTLILSFGPFLVYYKFFQESTSLNPTAFSLLGAGIAYFPMATLAVAMSQSIAGANPIFVILSILKIPGSYLVACILLGLTMTALGAAMLFPEILPIPIVGIFLSYFALLYFTAVLMRILGLTYYLNRRRLGWFSRI